MLDAGDYVEINKDINTKVQEFVLPRLTTHIHRTDYWFKMLRSNPDKNVVKKLYELLINKSTVSMFDWQRFYLWKLALYLPENSFSQKLIDRAIATSNNPQSDNVASQAIIFIGKHGNNEQRISLFTRLFNPQKSFLIQRSVLIAIQELSIETRNFYYTRALEINSDHKELIDYLRGLTSPNYGITERTTKHCKEEREKPRYVIKRGIGIVRGRIRRFRISREDYDY